MSTYTDLKNRVKETITVGFRPEDRITVQKVRFLNEENEYWGSFSGSLSGKINIYQGKLSSVDIYNARFIDPTIETSGGIEIPLATWANQFDELSVCVYEDLCAAVSSCVQDVRDLSDAVQAMSAEISSELCSQISANRKDIDFLLWTDRKSMVYHGTLLSAHMDVDKHLSCYFQNALDIHPIDPAFMFKTGFTYRLSATQTDLFGPDGETVTLRPGDILIFNNDTRLSSVCASDFDIISMDSSGVPADLSGLSAALSGAIVDLSVALSGEIDSLSAALSGEIGSVSAVLSGEIDSLSAALSGEIGNLSTALSGEIGGLSTALSGEIGSLSAALSGEIGSLSAALSGEISGLSAVLSGEIGNLSTALSTEINSLSTALSGEIDGLSADLSGEIGNLSTALSGEIGGLSTALSGEIGSLSVALSGEISSLSDVVSATIGASIVPGNPGIVKCVDEYMYPGETSYRKYEMHVISGTIKLERIS